MECVLAARKRGELPTEDEFRKRRGRLTFERRTTHRGRPTVVEALAAFAAERRDQIALGRPLDPFCDEPRPECAAEADDRAQQRFASILLVDRRREAPIDLHDVDRQLLQIGERAVARAEIVERDLALLAS